MEIIANTLDFYIERDTAVAIGKFDGVHLGHRRLLDEILLAKKRGLAACVFTFDPPPSALFGKDKRVLTTNEEKHILFERMGIDILVEFPLNAQSAATPPRDFVVDYLVSQMNTRFIAAGMDVSFGDKGLGNAGLLKQLSIECGYDLKLIDKVCTEDGLEISSSLVRDYALKGEMEKVEMLLGMPYSVSGTIVHGRSLGRTLGFPTINIIPSENKILPPFGVYRSTVIIDGRQYNGVTNIGCKPTVTNANQPLAETFIYDFDCDVYGQEASVLLESFRRPEQKFDSLEALKRQLQADIEDSRR